MQLSLLNREKAKAAVSNSAIYHFSLDRVFSEVCADAEKRDYFLSVIAAPLDSDKEINYRRDVLRELYENRHVLQSLSSLQQIRLSTNGIVAVRTKQYWFPAIHYPFCNFSHPKGGKCRCIYLKI